MPTLVLATLQALAEEHSDREVWWLHGARSSRQHPFAAEARALLVSLPNVRVHVCYSRPGPGDLEGRDFNSAGCFTASLLAQLDLPRNAQAYLCGPTPFMEEISAGLAAVGIEASRIDTEPFGPGPGLAPGIAATPGRAPHPPTGRPGSGPTIDFARSDLTIPWSSDYGSQLELAEACDVPVRWSYRTGVCHTCETTLIAGNVKYGPDPVEPPGNGRALICCSQPRDDIVLDLGPASRPQADRQLAPNRRRAGGALDSIPPATGAVVTGTGIVSIELSNALREARAPASTGLPHTPADEVAGTKLQQRDSVAGRHEWVRNHAAVLK